MNAAWLAAAALLAPIIGAIAWRRIVVTRPLPIREDRPLLEPMTMSVFGLIICVLGAALGALSHSSRLNVFGGMVAGWLTSAGGWWMVLEPAERYARRDTAAVKRLRKLNIRPASTTADHLRSYRHTGLVLAILGSAIFLFMVKNID
jgi:hypothetical protein